MENVVDVVASDRSKAIEELVRGSEFANQLRQLIINGGDDQGLESATPFAQSLVTNVLNSFTNAIFLLNKYPTSQSHDQVSQVQKSASSSFITPTKSEDSQESCKSSTIKDRRGCYKRRRTTQTYETLSKTPTADGHQWRKYGQKLILKSKYSRCTHKIDQGCKATKQVQQVQEEPPLHRITYYGHHTCTNLLLNPEIILDSNSAPNDSSILLSFNNTFPIPTKQEFPFSSPSFPSPPLEECKEELPSISFSDNYVLPVDPTLDNSFRHDPLSSTLQSHHGDVLNDSFDLVDILQHFAGFL